MILTITLNPSIDRKYVVDGFERGKIFRPKEVQYTPGGKGLNVTKVIKSFGEPVTATGFLGGRSGSYIKEKLDNMEVCHKFIPIDGETRSCIAILSNDKSQTEILEKGPSISEKEALEFLDLYNNIIKDYEVICASGSLPKGLAADTYKSLINIANEQGKKFILDTSGEALKLGIEASPFLIKPNKEEMENLIGHTITTEDEIIRVANCLLEKGVEIVVVSLGKEGAMVFYDGYAYKIKVPNIKAVNPVGSGDSMIAGFAVSIVRDYDFQRMLKVAAASGTANAMESETGKVDMNNMRKIMDKIEIDRIRI